MPPRISVVVPVYDVEAYLAECLQSIARQTVRDLEVVVVDDGSRDSSADIAESFAARDGRFRLLRQANAGLGAARNTGTRHATGEYLAFVDSDDVLPPDAYAHLLGALEQTGSDFATGNVLRMTSAGTFQSRFLRHTYTRTRLKTHVTRFRPLLADRTAWNKLFRRAFWDRHDFAFPEGVVHEDIPVTLPAHFLAKSVDVVSDYVYQWRSRPGEGLSITQRRLHHDVLHDRLAACQHVVDFLRAHQPAEQVRSYQEWLVGDDLRFHMSLLPLADQEYREMFLEGANRLLDGAPDEIFADLRAINRLEWHLLRRRKLEELVEVVRFHRDEMGRHAPVRRGLRWYGAYPYRDDAALGVPKDVYRLGRNDFDLTLRVELEGVRRTGSRLELHGLAYVIGFGAPRRYSQRVRFSLLAPGGRFRRLRLRVGAIGLPTTRVHRTDVPPKLAWAGFKITLDPAELQARTGDATWELSTHVLTQGLSRRRTRFWLRSREFARTIGLPAPGGGLVDVSTGIDGSVRVRSRAHWAAVHEARLEGADLVLEGDARMPAGAPERVEARRESDGASFGVDVTGDAQRFGARIPLVLVRDAPDSPERAAGAPDVTDTWTLTLHGSGASLPLVLDADATRFTALGDGHGISLESKRWGDAVLVDRLRPLPAARQPPAPAAPQRSSPAGA